MKDKLMIMFLAVYALCNAGAGVPAKDYPPQEPKGMNGPAQPNK